MLSHTPTHTHSFSYSLSPSRFPSSLSLMCTSARGRQQQQQQEHHFDGFKQNRDSSSSSKGERLKREQVERGLRSKRALTLDVCFASSTRLQRRLSPPTTVGTSANDVTARGPSKTRLNSERRDLWGSRVAPLAFFYRHLRPVRRPPHPHTHPPPLPPSA